MIRTPTYQAMLTKAGFCNIEAMYFAWEHTSTIDKRTLEMMITAFHALEPVENQLSLALTSMAIQVGRETHSLAVGNRVDASWVAKAAAEVAEQAAKLHA